MQEDIDHRAVALVINTTKMTGRALKSAITKYLAHCRQKAKAPPTGRQTVRELVGQGQGVTNIEITDGNIRSFERVARKYGVDYACLLYTSISGNVVAWETLRSCLLPPVRDCLFVSLPI